jgi:hypothetical protein
MVRKFRQAAAEVIVEIPERTYRTFFAAYTAVFQYVIWFMAQMPEINEQGGRALRITCGILALIFSVLALVL